MIEEKAILLSYSKNCEIIVPGIVEIKRLSEEFGEPSSEYGHYPYEMKYWIEKEVNTRYHLGSFGVNMDSKPKITDYLKSPLPSWLAQQDKNRFRMKELIYLTNILSEHHFFQYRTQQNWYIDMEERSSSKWGQTMFSPSRELGTLTTKSAGNNEANESILHLIAGDAQNRIDITFSELVKIYFDSADDAIKSLIYQNIRTFSKSLELGTIDCNASYLFFYSVLESLAEEEYKSVKNEKCESCKQTVFSVSKKLKALLDKYCYQISNSDKNKLYELRSEIVHKGKMLPFTKDHQWVMETQEDLDAYYYSKLSQGYFEWLRNITKLTMKNYIYQKLKNA